MRRFVGSAPLVGILSTDHGHGALTSIAFTAEGERRHLVLYGVAAFCVVCRHEGNARIATAPASGAVRYPARSLATAHLSTVRHG